MYIKHGTVISTFYAPPVLHCSTTLEKLSQRLGIGQEYIIPVQYQYSHNIIVFISKLLHSITVFHIFYILL